MCTTWRADPGSAADAPVGLLAFALADPTAGRGRPARTRGSALGSALQLTSEPRVNRYIKVSGSTSITSAVEPHFRSSANARTRPNNSLSALRLAAFTRNW